MSDMIDRQSAIDAMAELQGRAYTKAELKGISKAWKRIKQLPSAQPDIIHCRECKNCQIDSVFHDYWCDGRKVWKDHYCGYAERRTDELGDS